MTQPADLTDWRGALGKRAIAVVGMNGVGKTNFGKRLASRMRLDRVDTDDAFARVHGDVHAFIGGQGWDAYRREEERIVLQELRPGRLLTLGGGAVESPAIRAALKERAIVLWMQAEPEKIHRHLARARVARPEFREGLHHEAVSQLLERRNPLYKEVADILLFPGTGFARQIPVAMLELRKRLRLPRPPRAHGRPPHPRRRQRPTARHRHVGGSPRKPGPVA